ncbi:hypothetical protein FRC04_008349 [Tulasnella sp. 424]|nr:hypothetical protein FRC04_008349 [Tulasnella sp. 424]KAG8959865.1 hypothetical protein FRC05_007224 [Tulasnella sp. 425]
MLVSPRHIQIILILFGFVFLVSLIQFRPSIRSQFQYYTTSTGASSATEKTSDHNDQTLLSISPSFDPSSPFTRRHVAVATSVGHSEVYGPLAWTINTVMTKHPRQAPASVKIYSGEPGFLSLLKRIGMLPKDIMRPRDQLSKDIRSTTLYEDDMGAMIDLVVLGTCELDMERFGPDLLKAWDERPHNKKFAMVCGVHNGQTTGWFKHISEWSRRGSFRVMPISDHVINYFHSMFNTWADSKDPAQRLALYEYIKVDAYYSVSDFTNFPLRPKTYQADVPCSAVLQGNYEQGRRDYERVFADLSRLLREDAKGWGYKWSADGRKYVTDSSAPNPPFVLHLIGKGKITVPAELRDVVVMDISLDTVPFYELFQAMDIVVPAFSEGGGYLTRQASSTVHTAVMNHVPLLATRAIFEAYPYLTSEGTILRPFALSEMEAIGLLRGAKVTAQRAEVSNGRSKSSISFDDLASTSASPGIPPKLAEDVKRMLSQGWKRSDEGFDRLKHEIWEKNENFVGRLLRDL